MSGIHPLDVAVILAYLFLVLFIGHRTARGNNKSQEDYFLAGRKLGKVYQFFLNFGNSTDANGAVSAASVVYQQGVSGIWLGFQLIFLNPYYWFMNMWFRRVRLVTMADLFEDRLDSRRLATFYALFQSITVMFVVIGFGNLITYKISAALVVKAEASWSVDERVSVEDYRALHALEKTVKAGGALEAVDQSRLTLLRERDARGELQSYITALRPLPFYIVYTLIVGLYVVIGGMTATAMNEVLQSILTILFSVILIPLGIAAVGGWEQLSVRVPPAMFELVSSTGTGAGQQVTATVLLAIFLVALVQINGIVGNMSISGSAKDEYAARFGAVAGTYGKRLMMIMWAFCGLIALALYQGPTALSDPDAAWGAMCRQLLGPGLLGLMLVGLLANNMDTVAAQTLAVSALFVRNVYRPMRPALSEERALFVGRCAIVGVLAVGILAATTMKSVFSALILMQTVAVPLGATVMLMFFWRRLTVPATWAGILIATAVNIVGPLLLPQISAVREHPMLVTRVEDMNGRPQPVYFESVVRQRTDADTAEGALEGRGRLHLELVVLKWFGMNVEQMSASDRFAARFFFDAALPFVLLIGVSLVTRPPRKEKLDQFFGRMKTPVGATPLLEAEAIAQTRANPGRFDHTKLFPSSSWEFAKWDRVDATGFLVCCAVSASIIGLFWWLLRLAGPMA